MITYYQGLDDRIKSNLDSKPNELNKILENRLNGYIRRSKAQIIEQNENKTKQILCRFREKNLRPKQ